MKRQQAYVRGLVTFALVLGVVLFPATPSAAAEFLNDGFESGDLSQWTPPSVNFTVQSAIKRTGNFAGRAFTSANDANVSKTLATTQSNFYLRAFVNVASHVSSTPILRVRTATGAVILTVNVNATNKLATNNAITGVNRQSTTTVTEDVFHEIQVHTRINGANGQVEVWYDGALVGALTSGVENLGTNPVGRFLLGRSGTSANAMDIYYDDVIAADAFITGGGGTAPATPTGLHTTSVTATQVVLAWNASSGATSYNIRRDGTVVGPSLTTTTFTDNGVTAGNSYQYTVDACNANGCSLQSSPPLTVSTASPGIPANLRTTLVQSNRVDLAWDASSGATSYIVRRTGGASFTDVTTPNTTFSDTTALPSNNYNYTVEACNSIGCSGQSAPLNVQTPATPPPAIPGNLRTTLVQSNRVDLAWNVSTGATNYNLRRTGGTGGPVTVNTTSLFHSDTTVVPNTDYSYTVDACNGPTNCSGQSAPLLVHTPAAGGGGTVVMAAGDIACDPTDTAFNNGNGTANKCRQKFTGALLAGANHVLPIGDTQYECAGTTAYAQSYNLTGWGAAKNISHPILSDEDYDTAGTGCGAAGPDGYFGYFQAQAPGDYYSVVDFATGWRFIALNSECAQVAGGCGENSPQNNFLEQTLVPGDCTIAMLHKPRFRSKANGAHVTAAMLPFWQDLTAEDAEIVIGGDSHFYERFNPMDVNGNFQAGGTVQFVVGVGGKSRGGLAAVGARHPQSAKGTAATFGVLKLTLHPGSYDWQFVVEGNNSFTDTGTAFC